MSTQIKRKKNANSTIKPTSEVIKMSTVAKRKDHVKEPETVTIYGAGGCGINIATMFQEYNKGDGYARLTPVYLDTSRSNIKDGVPDSQCFILPDMDGSGKVRAENAGEISSHISKVLDSHKPSKFNIVVFSTGGGTGSVFGPLLARELARRAIPQVLVVVSEADSAIAAQNALGTYKTLESIYRSVNEPLVVSWHKNSTDTPRPVVDENVYDIINKLAVLSSGQNRELDSRDLNNWVYYTRPRPDLKPQLCLLTVTDDSAIAQKIDKPLSAINLLNDTSSVTKDLKPEYSTNGYIPTMSDAPDHGLIYVASIGEVEDIAKGVLEDNNQYKELSKTRQVEPKPLLDDKDTVTDDGLVL